MPETRVPELGVGVIFVPGLEPLIENPSDIVQVVEVEPQMFWLFDPLGKPHFRADPRIVETLQRCKARKLVHGVGFPVGGSLGPGTDHLASYLEALTDLGSPWCSEHLSFNQATTPEGMFNTGFLLPPLQTLEGAEAAAKSIRAFADCLPVPFAAETGVNYLQVRDGELRDGAFVQHVVERADCGILLDLHNLWTNERNGRQTVLDFVDEIPLARVWEIHLAGGLEYGGYWLDAHSGEIPDPLFDLAAEIIPRLPNLGAIVYEILAPFVPQFGLEGVQDQLRRMQSLWDLRRSGPICGSKQRTAAEPTASDCSTTIRPEEWERSLGSLVIGRTQGGELSDELGNDPGVGLLNSLVKDFRAGMIVDSLKLTCQLLLLHGGPSLLRALLAEFWDASPPNKFATEEAKAFGNYLASRELDCPYLSEVLRFEIETIDVLVKDEFRTAHFSVDPAQLLDALGQGHWPLNPTQGDFSIEISPPA